MSGDAFRDAIAQALEFWGDDGAGAEMLPDDDGAAAILAMPEMQAIRVALRDLTASWHHHAGAAVLRDAFHLPQSVIDWALGGQP